MKNVFLLLFILVAISANAQIKNGYAINFKVNGLKDTTAYLAYYFGESTYIRDTARVNSKGEFVFDGKNPLPEGWYFLVLNKTKFMDLMVGPSQHFGIETDTAGIKDPLGKVVFKNDIDNTLYYDNLAHNQELSRKAEPFVKVIQDSTVKDEAKKKQAQEGLKKISEEAQVYQDKIIAEHPATMTAKLFKTARPIVIPDPPKQADGSVDSMFQLYYYREHFFDNFNLADDALTRLSQPLYSKKLSEYLDKLYAQQPDTIVNAITKLVSMARKNPETYKFMIWTLTGKYATPEYMGMDEVFVQLYYKYYATGEMDFWANEKYKKNLKDLADKYCKSLIGKTGPNLMMQDVNLQPRSLYDTKSKYTILYIYDPDCGSCKKETPVLVDFYAKNKAKFNVEVFAVSIDTSMVKMRNYIKEMGMKWINVNGPRTYLKTSYHEQYNAETTPSLFVLDQRHKIIANKISAARLEDFLTNYEKLQKLRAANPAKYPEHIPFDCSKPVVKTVPPKS